MKENQNNQKIQNKKKKKTFKEKNLLELELYQSNEKNNLFQIIIIKKILNIDIVEFKYCFYL